MQRPYHRASLIRWREIEWELLPLDNPSARHLDDRQLFRWQGKTVLFRSDADGTALPVSNIAKLPSPKASLCITGLQKSERLLEFRYSSAVRKNGAQNLGFTRAFY